MEAGAAELVPLALIAVEDIDVDGASDAIHASVGSQLPVDQLDVRLVFAVAGYPDVVALLDVGSVGHVAVDETLVDVENGLHACAPFHILHEDADAAQQLFGTTYLAYLGICGLHVQDGREVVRPE